MQQEKNYIEVLFGRRWIRHLLFWISYVLTMTYIHGLGIQEGNYLPWFLNYLVELPVILGLTYFVTWYVIPKFILLKKYFISVLLIISGFLFFSFLNVILDKYIIGPNFMAVPSGEINLDIKRILTNAFGLVFPVVIFVAVSFAKYTYLKSNKGGDNFQDKLKSELEMMRNQMHPVFLRDALDDIYIMSTDNPGMLPEMILRISDILHYFLYECNVDKLPLRKEEQSIRTFLGFEKLRYGANFDYDIFIKGDMENTLISPYILFPLIRSACRFNDGYEQHPGKVFIQMEIVGTSLNFSVSQSVHPEVQQDNYNFDWKNEIAMARKRLDLIYEWKYKLDIMETERKLIVNLYLDLS